MPSRNEADRIARALLEARAAACVQVIGPIESHYWWQGSIESASELLCVAKTAAARVDEAVATIAAHHSYDVPEITVVPITGGGASYLAWIDDEVTRPAG